MPGGDGPDEERVSSVLVESLSNGGMRIEDRIERRKCTVRTESDVAPFHVDGERFRHPIDVAVEVSTPRLSVEPTGVVYVHGEESTTEVELLDEAAFPAGSYRIELSTPLKLYLAVDGPLEVGNRANEAEVHLQSSARVVVGARSNHQHPAATVVTTDDPVDLTAAVSTFGSALKTLDSRRSYPSLRGHPPTLEVGEELSIPSGLDPPADDVRIEVPPATDSVLTAAPLAYYLGAPVGPGDRPALFVDGTRHELDGDPGFETTVGRTLKQTFLMDCLVRTAGPRGVTLHERETLEDRVRIDPKRLYGRPAAERLAAYLDVPYGRIEDQLPTWKLTAHVQPTRAGIEALPFLANDLAVIRTHDGPAPSAAFTGDPGDRHAGSGGPTDGDRTEGEPGRPFASDSVEQAWVGRGVPVGASKTIPAAYRNRLRREPREDDIEIVVVCNDDQMLEEGVTVREVYEANQDLPFDVTFRNDLTAGELRGILRSDLDYLHYVGHVTEGGLDCTDGVLDVSDMESVGVDIALLNACRSYDQGIELIQKGAVAGVVTFDEVLNSGAVRIGKTMARLLNQGFPLRSALTIARERSIVGSQYLVVGDGNADIAQPSGVVPWMAIAEPRDAHTYEVRVVPYPPRARMGMHFRPTTDDSSPVFLIPGELPPVTFTEAQLRDYFANDTFPVLFDGNYTWSDEVVDRL